MDIFFSLKSDDLFCCRWIISSMRECMAKRSDITVSYNIYIISKILLKTAQFVHENRIDVSVYHHHRSVAPEACTMTQIVAVKLILVSNIKKKKKNKIVWKWMDLYIDALIMNAGCVVLCKILFCYSIQQIKSSWRVARRSQCWHIWLKKIIFQALIFHFMHSKLNDSIIYE